MARQNFGFGGGANMQQLMRQAQKMQQQMAEAQEKLDALENQSVSVPLGSALGVALLSGMGPDIRVSILPVGAVVTQFSTEFTSAGINQTKHQIVLNIEVYVSILLPGFTADTQVSNAVTVAETIIVGSVPDTYTYFATDPSNYDEYILSTS